jgi:hypothetical protein
VRLAFLLPLLAFALYGADVSGNWTGAVDVQDPGNGQKISTSVRAEFNQTAETVTGKIGRTQDAQLEPIRNGKLTGKSLTFEVMAEETGSTIMRFTLTMVSEDRIEGELSGAIDAGKISGKVVLTRSK